MENLVIPFIFVRKGDPEPKEWLAQHPGAIKIPAKMVPRSGGATDRAPQLQVDLNAALKQFASLSMPPAFNQSEANAAPIMRTQTSVSPPFGTADYIDPVTAYNQAQNALRHYLSIRQNLEDPYFRNNLLKAVWTPTTSDDYSSSPPLIEASASTQPEPASLGKINQNAKENLQPSAKSVNDQAADDMRSVLVAREGYRNDVYLDSLNHLTVGIGHKVTLEDHLKVGDTISDKRVEELYQADSKAALEAARAQAAEAGIKNESFITSLAMVIFQLGRNWQKKFKNTWKLIVAGRYSDASRKVLNSEWASQAPDRANDFSQALLNLPPKQKQNE